MSKPTKLLLDMRDLHPHKEALVAMLLWNREYAASGRGSMNFYEHYLSNSERQICREEAAKITAAPAEARRPR